MSSKCRCSKWVIRLVVKNLARRTSKCQIPQFKLELQHVDLAKLLCWYICIITYLLINYAMCCMILKALKTIPMPNYFKTKSNTFRYSVFISIRVWYVPLNKTQTMCYMYKGLVQKDLPLSLYFVKILK